MIEIQNQNNHAKIIDNKFSAKRKNITFVFIKNNH
jgi:hypothetical protein